MMWRLKVLLKKYFKMDFKKKAEQYREDI